MQVYAVANEHAKHTTIWLEIIEKLLKMLMSQLFSLKKEIGDAQLSFGAQFMGGGGGGTQPLPIFFFFFT